MKDQILFLLLGTTLFVLTSGCDPETYHVDKDNTSGPWDGSSSAPFKTIQDGLNAAGSKDTVIVRGGFYRENLIMHRGTTLKPHSSVQTVIIEGDSGTPTITSHGRNHISGFIIEGGTAAIKIDLKQAFENPSIEKIENHIVDCEIRNTVRGIELVTPMDLAYENSKKKSIYLHILHNYIHDLGGDGIHCTLNGPATGQLQISLDIRDNILYNTFTGVTANALGKGPNPGGIVRASYAGFIKNNLIVKGFNGIMLHSENLGSVDPFVLFNTIANNNSHGISASTEAGSDGNASTNPKVNYNIILGNGGYGYQEFNSRSSASSLGYNLFYQNMLGHYADEQTGRIMNSVSELNTPIVNNQVVFYGGTGNQIADPRFIDGEFRWENSLNFTGPHKYFLQQDSSALSPAIDKTDITVTHAGLTERTTEINYVYDLGIADIGFHYKNP